MSLITKSTGETAENDATKSNQPPEFRRWANDLREVHAMRLKATGRGGGGGVKWWADMPPAFKVFVLSTIADDDWERYEHAPWDALPQGLRSCIAMECRAIVRVASGCPWR